MVVHQVGTYLFTLSVSKPNRPASTPVPVLVVVAPQPVLKLSVILMGSTSQVSATWFKPDS